MGIGCLYRSDMRRYAALVSFLCALPHTWAASPAQWKGRSIYQVLTDRFARSDGSTTAQCDPSSYEYCDGTWQGLIDRLDYIKGMGFSAVWISPITEQMEGNSNTGDPYHGYWQSNIDALNSHFGSADDLHSLSSAVHDRGMYLMVDIVVNHFAWPGDSSSVNYSSFTPFNKESYFHSYCQISQDDYSNNQTAVEDCWLGDSNCELVDVDTNAEDVQEVWNSWVSGLVSKYSIDGFRVDTVKHVQKDFWSSFNKAAGVYMVGEVADGNLDYVCPYQDVMDGVFNYMQYYVAKDALAHAGGDMESLRNLINGVKSNCKDTTLLSAFSENHDVPRVPSYTDDEARDRNLIALTLMSDGIPSIYQGQEQYYRGGADPGNREALWTSGYNTDSDWYKYITKLNNLRNHAANLDSGSGSYLDFQALPIHSDDSSLALLKGFKGNQMVSVYSNRGSNGGTSNATIEATTFDEGSELVEVVSCNKVSAGDNGTLTIEVAGDPQIFYAQSNLKGSGICGQ